MQETISELWKGNLAPFDHCGTHDREAYRLGDLMEQYWEDLSQELTDPQKALLQKFADASDQHLFRMMELAFCQGFCVGSRLMIETFSE